jgi:primosomal protein N'
MVRDAFRVDPNTRIFCYGIIESIRDGCSVKVPFRTREARAIIGGKATHSRSLADCIIAKKQLHFFAPQDNPNPLGAIEYSRVKIFYLDVQ